MKDLFAGFNKQYDSGQPSEYGGSLTWDEENWLLGQVFTVSWNITRPFLRKSTKEQAQLLAAIRENMPDVKEDVEKAEKKLGLGAGKWRP